MIQTEKISNMIKILHLQTIKHGYFGWCIDQFNRVGRHVVSVRIHCTEKWRTSFHTDVLSKSK